MPLCEAKFVSHKGTKDTKKNTTSSRLRYILQHGINLRFALRESSCPLCSSWLEFTTEGTKNTKIHKGEKCQVIDAEQYISRSTERGSVTNSV